MEGRYRVNGVCYLVNFNINFHKVTKHSIHRQWKCLTLFLKVAVLQK